MTRTMDVYDTRMGTFGGDHAKNKNANFDKFIEEKRGFIRTTNLYQNSDPMNIVAAEALHRNTKGGVNAPGPAFETNFDNKYQQNTVFANSDGRVKEALKPNKLTSEFL